MASNSNNPLQQVGNLLTQRPILVGGLGLTAGLWLLNSLHHALWDGATLSTTVAVGTGIWWWRRRSPASTDDTTQLAPVAVADRPTVAAALEQLHPLLQRLQAEAETVHQSDAWAEALANFEQRRSQLGTDLDRTTLKLALVGSPRSGKTALKTGLESGWVPQQPTPVDLVEVTLASGTNDSDTATLTASVGDRDAVLYLLTEDLTDSAWADLQALQTAGLRVLPVLNKQDQYLPGDRDAVLAQIRQRLQALPQVVEGVAIAAAPAAVKVRTHQTDGQTVERWETPGTDLSALTPILDQWVAQSVPHLVCQTVMRQTQQLRRDIQTGLNHLRRDRARPVVEQLQWAAAATAFASPMPTLDLLAAAAINGQLLMDLGRIYQQPLALDQAKAAAGTLASLVVKLGLVEASTQVLTAALKGHAATYVVGGSVQALSAAYLTHLAAESLMDYFEERALAGTQTQPLSIAAIGDKLQALMQQTQQTAFVKKLVQQGIQRLHLTSASPTLATADAAAIAPESEAATVAKSETIQFGEPA